MTSKPRGVGGVPLTAAEIRDLRGARTRKAFARHLGVSVATVYLWEAGRIRPSARNRARLERVVARVKALAASARRNVRRTAARSSRS